MSFLWKQESRVLFSILFQNLLYRKRHSGLDWACLSLPRAWHGVLDTGESSLLMQILPFEDYNGDLFPKEHIRWLSFFVSCFLSGAFRLPLSVSCFSLSPHHPISALSSCSLLPFRPLSLRSEVQCLKYGVEPSGNCPFFSSWIGSVYSHGDGMIYDDNLSRTGRDQHAIFLGEWPWTL